MKIYARVLAVLLVMTLVLSVMPYNPVFATGDDVATGAETEMTDGTGEQDPGGLSDSDVSDSDTESPGDEVSDGDVDAPADGTADDGEQESEPAEDSAAGDVQDVEGSGESGSEDGSETATPSDAEPGVVDGGDAEMAKHSVTVAFPVVKDGEAVFVFQYSVQYPAVDEESGPVQDDGSFELVSGGSETLADLPEGTAYTLDLTVPEGYEFEQVSWSGIVGVDGDVVIEPVLVSEPETEIVSFQAEAEGLTVSAVADIYGLSPDAELYVSELEPEAAATAETAVREGLALSEKDELYLMPYDVYFMDGVQKVEPESGTVELLMTFETAPFTEEIRAAKGKTELFIVHICGDGTVEKIEPEWLSDTELKFSVKSFSVMGLALVVSAPEKAAGLDGEYTDIYVPKAPDGMDDAAWAPTVKEAFEHLANGGTVWLTENVSMNMVRLSGTAATVRSYESIYTLTKSGDSENMFALSNEAALVLEKIIVDASDNTQGRTVMATGGSKLTLGVGAILENNTAYGAVYLDDSDISIEGGTIRNNGAVENNGGAVFAANGSDFTMSSGKLCGNSAVNGGAVYFAADEAAVRFTVTGGTISGNSAANNGSVVCSDTANITVDISGAGTVFSKNNAVQSGGIYLDNPTGVDGAPAVNVHDGVTFENNYALRGSCLYAVNCGGLALTIDSATFTGNHADWGGALYNRSSPATITLQNSTFTGNKADDGGGVMWMTGTLTDNVIVVKSCRFEDNSAGASGGVVLNQGCSLTVDDCQFINNKSDVYAGALCVNLTNDNGFNLSNSVFRGNSANGNGGAVYCVGHNSDFTVDNCEFTDNKSGKSGGAVYCVGDNGDFTVDNCEFTDNKSGESGGGFMAFIQDSTVTVTGNSVFRGNSADVNAGAFSVRRNNKERPGTVQLQSAVIDGNWCNADFSRYGSAIDYYSTQHYNTGGVYIGENITCYMQDALVTGNYVESGYAGSTVGNGIGLCPNAQVFLYPEHGATIYGNGDNGGMDIVAVPYDEVINHETPAMLYVSDVTPDGRPYNWTDLDNEEARTGMYDWTNIRSGIATMAANDGGYHGETTLEPVGFKSNISNAGIMPMAASNGGGYQVRIIGNYSKNAKYAAGGMMVNGTVISGELEITVEKKVEGLSSSEKATKEFRFTLSISSEDSNFNSDIEMVFAKGAETKSDKFTFVPNDGGSGGTASYSFTLKADEKITFSQLKASDESPFLDDVDYTFALTETDNGGATLSLVTWSAYDDDGNELNGEDFSVSAGPGTIIKKLAFVCRNVFSEGLVRVAKSSSSKSDTEFTFKLEQIVRASGAVTPGNWQDVIEEKALGAGIVYDVYENLWSGEGPFVPGHKVGESQVVGPDGTFKLKAGQYAELHLPSDSMWLISELPTDGFELKSMAEKMGTDYLERMAPDTILVSTEAIEAGDVLALKAEVVDKDTPWVPGFGITKDMFKVTLYSKDGSWETPLNSQEFDIDVRQVPTNGTFTVTFTDKVTGESLTCQLELQVAQASSLILEAELAEPGKTWDTGESVTTDQFVVTLKQKDGDWSSVLQPDKYMFDIETVPEVNGAPDISTYTLAITDNVTGANLSTMVGITVYDATYHMYWFEGTKTVAFSEDLIENFAPEYGVLTSSTSVEKDKYGSPYKAGIKIYDNSDAVKALSIKAEDVEVLAVLDEMYVDAIYIEGLSNLESSHVTGFDKLSGTITGVGFTGCSSLRDLNFLDGLDIQPYSLGTTDTDAIGVGCFMGCSKLQDISVLSQWDVSDVDRMGHCFDGCSSLNDLSPIKDWDISRVEYMRYCFANCTGVDQSGWSVLDGWSPNGRLLYLFFMLDAKKVEGAFRNCTGRPSWVPSEYVQYWL